MPVEMDKQTRSKRQICLRPWLEDLFEEEARKMNASFSRTVETRLLEWARVHRPEAVPAD